MPRGEVSSVEPTRPLPSGCGLRRAWWPSWLVLRRWRGWQAAWQLSSVSAPPRARAVITPVDRQGFLMGWMRLQHLPVSPGSSGSIPKSPTLLTFSGICRTIINGTRCGSMRCDIPAQAAFSTQLSLVAITSGCLQSPNSTASHRRSARSTTRLSRTGGPRRSSQALRTDWPRNCSFRQIRIPSQVRIKLLLQPSHSDKGSQVVSMDLSHEL